MVLWRYTVKRPANPGRTRHEPIKKHPSIPCVFCFLCLPVLPSSGDRMLSVNARCFSSTRTAFRQRVHQKRQEGGICSSRLYLKRPCGTQNLHASKGHKGALSHASRGTHQQHAAEWPWRRVSFSGPVQPHPAVFGQSAGLGRRSLSSNSAAESSTRSRDVQPSGL